MSEQTEPTQVVIHLPEVSDDQISNDLVWLTEHLMKTQGAETSGGFLGGEYGYGAYFENETFEMHPYCWCEGHDCRWCRSCACEWEDRGEEFEWDVRYAVTAECKNCATERETGAEIERAANFLHKPSGTAVTWYKYIGRGMEVDLRGDWRTILRDCADSLTTPPPAPTEDVGGAGVGAEGVVDATVERADIYEEPRWLDCTCGHPNDDHGFDGCPVTGCGCSGEGPSRRASDDPLRHFDTRTPGLADESAQTEGANGRG